jgi:hypothetical protein
MYLNAVAVIVNRRPYSLNPRAQREPASAMV